MRTNRKRGPSTAKLALESQKKPGKPPNPDESGDSGGTVAGRPPVDILGTLFKQY